MKKDDTGVSLGHIPFLKTVLALLVSFTTILSLFGVSLFAAEYEHLGAPPKGKVFIELRSEPSSAPIQLAGTSTPATLLLNGKPIGLNHVPSQSFGQSSGLPFGDRSGIWVNDQDFPIHGSIGRFFVNLTGSDAAVGSLDIIIQDNAKKIFKATVPINRTFLDAPLTTKIMLEVEKEQSLFDLYFSGKIPDGSTLEVTDGNVITSHEQTKILVKLPLGKSVLAATLTQKDGSKRVLNVPLTVNRTSFQEGIPSLSLLPPGNNSAYHTWALPPEGLEIKGFTTPGSVLKVRSVPTTVGEDGRFSFLFRPNEGEKRGSLDFQITLATGQTKNYIKHFVCKNCQAPVRPPTEEAPSQTSEDLFEGIYKRKKVTTWYSPDLPEPGFQYLLLPLGEVTWMTPRNSGVSTTELVGTGIFASSFPGRPIIGAGYGYYLSRTTNFEGRIERLIPISGTVENRAIGVSSVFITALAYWSPVPVFSIGLGLSDLITTVTSSSFATSPSGAGHVIATTFSFQLRFPAFEGVEWVPSLMVIPAQLSLSSAPVKWHVFSIRPLSLRVVL